MDGSYWPLHNGEWILILNYASPAQKLRFYLRSSLVPASEFQRPQLVWQCRRSIQDRYSKSNDLFVWLKTWWQLETVHGMRFRWIRAVEDGELGWRRSPVKTLETVRHRRDHAFALPSGAILTMWCKFESLVAFEHLFEWLFITRSNFAWKTTKHAVVD